MWIISGRYGKLQAPRLSLNTCGPLEEYLQEQLTIIEHNSQLQLCPPLYKKSFTISSDLTMIPILDIPHSPPPGFAVREATLADVGDLTRLWYSSFNPSHKFWDIVTPRDAVTRQWWDAAWTLGIDARPTVLKTFVVEDLSHGGRLVAFARWNVPQADGSQDIPLPDYPAAWDPELTEALWGGMPKNRADVMGRHPHWSEFPSAVFLFSMTCLGE